MESRTGPRGVFEFRDLARGTYVFSVRVRGTAGVTQAVRVQAEGLTDVGSVLLRVGAFPERSDPVRVVTVCEALDQRELFYLQRLVIVGIFKSGMDETLRLDCPTQLVSGEVGWPSSIGLTRPAQPPDELREQVEKKRQELLKSAPPEAPLRPERVIGLYGIFVSLAGLTAARCCSAAVETVYPPARLFGLDETDLRVIR